MPVAGDLLIVILIAAVIVGVVVIVCFVGLLTNFLIHYRHDVGREVPPTSDPD
jgi:hypothetical protein